MAVTLAKCKVALQQSRLTGCAILLSYCDAWARIVGMTTNASCNIVFDDFVLIIVVFWFCVRHNFSFDLSTSPAPSRSVLVASRHWFSVVDRLGSFYRATSFGLRTTDKVRSWGSGVLRSSWGRGRICLRRCGRLLWWSCSWGSARRHVQRQKALKT